MCVKYIYFIDYKILYEVNNIYYFVKNIVARILVMVLTKTDYGVKILAGKIEGDSYP